MTISTFSSFRAKTLLAVITVLFTAELSFARVINVPGDQPTIQAGINAAANGDTVLVAPGIYREIINFSGKAITVTSSGGASVTIIDGRQQGSVVTFSTRETNSSVLNGFTLQNGNAAGSPPEGGGVACYFTSPTITNNIIQNNISSYEGGGIGSYFGSPIIINNLITNNAVPNGLQGGGIGIGGASQAQVIGNVISNNTTTSFGGGIGLYAAGPVLIENNVISGNNGDSEGGGISIINAGGDGIILQNLIDGNSSQDGNGIYWGQAPAVLADNTITDGPLSQGNSTISADLFAGMIGISNNIIVAAGGSTYAFSCNEDDFPHNLASFNDVFSAKGNPYGGMCTNQTGMAGNISADPKFVANGFSLQPSSPAIDVGNNTGLNLLPADILNKPRIVNGKGGPSAVVDIGAYEFFPDPIQWVSLTPCRLVDTRRPNGPFGGPPLAPGIPRSFAIPNDPNCSIPATALAYSLNVTVVPSGHLGYLTIWPTGPMQPVVSTMNSTDGRTKANAALVEAGNSGAVSVFATDATNVVVDIDGYFAVQGPQTMQFYALAPCRVADTRSDNFPQGLGIPHLSQGVARDFPVLNATSCNIPPSAQAYSLNFTAIPYPNNHPLAYLEVWPTGQQPQNPVSTLNNPTGTYVANAAIVPAGSSGEITAYPSDNTDLVIDINGYFAAPETGGLSLYPTVPCRVFDTRKIGNGQAFSGTLSPPVDVVDSPCGVPAAAQAYVFNATVVPSPNLSYLTLWPDSQGQPVVSTLNAADGWIASNMAIVPNVNGKIDAYAAGMTQLILDISAYFAP